MSDDAPSMTSYRPYLLRALTEWINDNGMTPHILVDAGVPGVRVPPGTVREGKVVLNIADRAVVGLHMDNEWIGFTARFGGVSQKVDVPVGAVLAVYARETAGHGAAGRGRCAGTVRSRRRTRPDRRPDPGRWRFTAGRGARCDRFTRLTRSVRLPARWPGRSHARQAPASARGEVGPSVLAT